MSGIGERRAGGKASARGVALLVLVLAVFVAPGLNAETSVSYPAGDLPAGP